MKKVMRIYAVVMAIGLLLLSFVLATGTQAQDIKTNYGCNAVLTQPEGRYNVMLTGISQKKAVDLCVDQIKAKCLTPQQVSCYIVEYSALTKLYTVALDERVQGKSGFPVYFTSLGDAKSLIKKDLKFALDNL
jgi:hypothetical protein